MPLMRQKSLDGQRTKFRARRGYMLVLFLSIAFWFGDVALPSSNSLQAVLDASQNASLGNLSELPVWEMLTLENLVGTTYYSVWVKLNEALAAAALHFEDAPAMPVYRMLPLIKAQLDYMSLHRIDRDVVLAEYDMNHARRTDPARLDDFVQHMGLASAAYEPEPMIRAYLESTGWALVQSEAAVGLEKPSYFVAFSHERKEAVICVKGTSSFTDFLTDFLHTPEPFLRGSYAHSGMLHAAMYIVNRTEHIVQHLLHPLKYKVTLVGHSLGAGTASLAAAIFRWERHVPRVRCVAFAPPPTLDADAAAATRDFVDAVVVGDDVIPRWNFGLMAANARVLADLDESMRASGKSAEAFFKEVDYVARVGELREKIEAMASAKGKHIDMHLAGALTLVARTTHGFMVRDVDNRFPALRRIEFSATMLSDHSLAAYGALVSGVLEQLRNASLDDDGGGHLQ